MAKFFEKELGTLHTPDEGVLTQFLRGVHGAYVDQTEVLYSGMGQNISFEHVPTGRTVFFKAFLKRFSDSYQSAWNSQSGYGRMDDVHQFQQTKRQLSLSFEVVAGDVKEAQENMRKVSIFTQMLYPTFERHGKAETIKAAPLIKLKFMNWAQNSTDGFGLLGACKGFNFSPTMEPGVFTVYDKTKHPGNRNRIYPKVFTIDTSLSIIHEHPLGWRKGEEVTKGNKGMISKMQGPTQVRSWFQPQAQYFPYGEDIGGKSGVKSKQIKANNPNAIKAKQDGILKGKNY